MNRRVLALGRLKSGQMNKSEAAYATALEAARIAQEMSPLSSLTDAATRLISPFYGLMASWRCTRSRDIGPTTPV